MLLVIFAGSIQSPRRLAAASPGTGRHLDGGAYTLFLESGDRGRTPGTNQNRRPADISSIRTGEAICGAPKILRRKVGAVFQLGIFSSPSGVNELPQAFSKVTTSAEDLGIWLKTLIAPYLGHVSRASLLYSGSHINFLNQLPACHSCLLFCTIFDKAHREPNTTATMVDVEKRSIDIAHDVGDKKSLREADISEQENAVGYKEYREALNLEVSDKEVGTFSRISNKPGFRPSTSTNYLIDAQSPLETGSRHLAHVPHYPSLAVHG